jgi:RNase H-fold protein (predicted Holliday junction resolvase)
MRVMALDVGDKKIGVAVSDTLPLTVSGRQAGGVASRSMTRKKPLCFEATRGVALDDTAKPGAGLVELL